MWKRLNQSKQKEPNTILFHNRALVQFIKQGPNLSQRKFQRESLTVGDMIPTSNNIKREKATLDLESNR